MEKKIYQELVKVRKELQEIRKLLKPRNTESIDMCIGKDRIDTINPRGEGNGDGAGTFSKS